MDERGWNKRGWLEGWWNEGGWNERGWNKRRGNECGCNEREGCRGDIVESIVQFSTSAGGTNTVA